MTFCPYTRSEKKNEEEDELDKYLLEDPDEIQVYTDILGQLHKATGLAVSLRDTAGRTLLSKSFPNCSVDKNSSASDISFHSDQEETVLIWETDQYAEYQSKSKARTIQMPIPLAAENIGALVLGPFWLEDELPLEMVAEIGCLEDGPLEERGCMPVLQKQTISPLLHLASCLIRNTEEKLRIRNQLEHEVQEHRKTKSDLKIQDSYFRNLFENAPDAIVVLNNQDEVLQVNQEFVKLFGFTKEEALGSYINDLIVPDIRKEEGSKATEEVAVGHTIDLTTVRKDKRGELIHVVIQGKPIVLDNNQIAVYGIYRNISETVKTQRIQKVMYRISEAVNACASNSEFFRQIYSEIHDLVPSAGLFIELYDIRRKEFQIPVLEEGGEDFQIREFTWTLSSQVVEQKRMLHLDKEQILKIVGEKKLMLQKIPLKWLGIPLMEQEQVIGVLGVRSFEKKNLLSLDTLQLLEFISVQVATAIRKKQTEFELKTLHRALDQSPFSVVVTDLDATIEYVNPEFCKVSGYQMEEVKGQNPRILNSGLNPETTFQSLWESLGEGKEWSGEFLNRKKSGELYWEKANISPVKDSLGEITHYIGVKEDITETKKIEQELVQAKLVAEESNHLKSVFLANMSHELRTPLNAIIGFSNLCNDSLPKESILEFVELINRSGNQLLGIIEDLLSFSSMENDLSVIRKNKFSLESFLLDIVGQAKEKQRYEHKEHIELQLKPDVRFAQVFVETDASKLQKTLLDLVKNALKFTDEGYVELGYLVQGRELMLYVRDTGVGIPKEKQNVIFEAFRQGDASSSRKYGGTGLGLSLAKRMVELLGGTIRVESELGKGATFWLSIPGVLSVTSKKQESEELIGAKVKRSVPSILVVEDEDSNFKLLHALLKRGDFVILRAENGQEAVDICRGKRKPDLVLMDIEMPLLDGLHATRKIREFLPELPIIAITAYAMEYDRERVLQAGCNSYIVKPVKLDELLSEIKKLLAS